MLRENDPYRPGLLAILGGGACLLIFLKLIGKIDWSWWFVLAPIWIPLAFAATLFALLVSFTAKES